MTPRRRFRCPLCRAATGREVHIVAEFDLDTDPVAVADVSGCAHAAYFGQLRGLTPGEEWQLIAAALRAWERRPGPGSSLDDGRPLRILGRRRPSGARRSGRRGVLRIATTSQ